MPPNDTIWTTNSLGWGATHSFLKRITSFCTRRMALPVIVPTYLDGYGDRLLDRGGSNVETVHLAVAPHHGERFPPTA